MGLQKLNAGNLLSDLFEHIRLLIDKARINVSITVNTELVMLYWNIGHSINENVLQNKRAGYGEEIMTSLSQQLLQKYGRGWSKQQLLHCLRSAGDFYGRADYLRSA